MRIAVSGTHRIGKTTLVEEFARSHRGFQVEPEPYEQLLEAGEEILDHYDPDAFLVQLEHLVTRLARRSPGERVIFDRSPFDFLAYIAASEERRLDPHPIGAELIELAMRGLSHLDLVVWLPLGSDEPGRRSFRRVVDSHLADIIGSDSFGLLSGREGPEILELYGSTSARLRGMAERVERWETDRASLR